MKVSNIQKSTASNSHSSKPFFNKNGEEGFFSKSNETEESFFSSITNQSKPALGENIDKTRQEAESTTSKIMLMPQTEIQNKGLTESQWALSNPGKVNMIDSTIHKSDEITMWNYLVGSPKMRNEHLFAMANLSIRWKNLLAKRKDIRIKIMGNASKSGNISSNNSLALARANAVKTYLTSVAPGRIPGDKIDVEGVGTKLPIADEDAISPYREENMARNRRVEVFLYVPTVFNDDLKLDMPFVKSVRWVNKPKSLKSLIDPESHLFHLPSPREADEFFSKAHAELWEVKGGTTAGFMQFITNSKWEGIYKDTKRNQFVTLDWGGQCLNPYYPIRDNQATFRYYGNKTKEDLAKKKTKGKLPTVGTPHFLEPQTIEHHDSPGFAVPLTFSDSKNPDTSLELKKASWRHNFVLVFGYRRDTDNVFRIMKHSYWSTYGDFNIPSIAKKRSAEPGHVFHSAWADGVPKAISPDSMSKAMTGPTARFLTRRQLHLFNFEAACRPHRK